jgi:hypothetical protein
VIAGGDRIQPAAAAAPAKAAARRPRNRCMGLLRAVILKIKSN